MSLLERFQRLLPSWLISDAGGMVPASLSVMIVDFRARAMAGLIARFPSYAPDDVALAALGRDRLITRGINEPSAAYAARISRAFDDHATRGNPFTLLRQLRAYLQADVKVATVDRRGNWYQINADGSEIATLYSGPFDWDGEPLSAWSRFWVVIYPVDGVPWSVSPDWGDSTLWGDGLWGHPELTIGTTATTDQVVSIRAIIRDWKPVNAVCEWIILAFDPASFQPSYSPGGTWGTWGNHTGAPVRLSTARYWRGPR